MVVIVATARTQDNQRAANEHLSVLHTWLGAADTGIAPGHSTRFDNLDKPRIDSKAPGKIADRKYCWIVSGHFAIS